MKKKMTARIKGAFFITKQANHHLVHILLGIIWFYIVKKNVPELGISHFLLALLGSELPDIEHMYYWFFRGKRDTYSLRVRGYLRHREWRELTMFLKENHKHLTALKFHCIQWMVILGILTIVSYQYDHIATFILLGAMVTHYCFDVVDDIIFLGYINPNWKKGIIRTPKLH